nr:coagulation factor VIII-like [Nerophis lumbriciformis]
MRVSLLLLLLLCTFSHAANTLVREYFIAAVEIGWDYASVGDADATSDQRLLSKDKAHKYIKAVYREYTDASYTVLKPRPPWTGIQGPVIVTQPLERVIIHFKNMASQPYSISPVGITYWKQSEGAGYDDSTGGKEKEDDAVFPGRYHKYVWDISAADGPTIDDPECLTYSYSSQVDPVRDINSGLIGALLICQSSAFIENKQRRNTAFVLLFAVFDESKSWYGEMEERSIGNIQRSNSRKKYHTINGYSNSTLPGLTMCQKRVIWHIIGIGSAPEIHSIQFQDHTLKVMKHRKVSMEVTPMTFATAEMKPGTVGRFLISCKINAHRQDGMSAMFKVESCPGPDLRNVQEDIYDEYGEDYFNAVDFQPLSPRALGRSSSGQQPRIWKRYIAAEELMWDYAPHLTAKNRDKPETPLHGNYKYKKVAYVEYTDRSFTKRKNTDRTLMGPILKGNVNDRFHITFKNMASHPFNIYPNDLTKVYPLQQSTNDAENDLRSMEVPPNGTFVYVWEITPDDGPMEKDPVCLSLLYQSTVSPERDLASGLVGTLLICKADTINKRGGLKSTDFECRLMFAVFDENRSWYAEENIYQHQNLSQSTNPDFYDSNVIYSINGIIYKEHQNACPKMCKTEVIYWLVANVGTRSNFLSVYFTGNLFKYNDLHQSVLTLFPMMSMAISMEMDILGEWEISAFDGSLKSRGMSTSYTVCPCGFGNPYVDQDEDIDGLADCVGLLPKSKRPHNKKNMVWVCKNNTESQYDTGDNIEWTVKGDQICQMRRLTVESLDGENSTSELEGGIPLDVLNELERNGEWIEDVNGTEHNRNGRQRRWVEGNGTQGHFSSAGPGNDKLKGQFGEKTPKNGTDTSVEKKTDQKNVMPLEINATRVESNEIIPDRNPSFKEKLLSESDSLEMDKNFRESHISNDSEDQTVDSPRIVYNSTGANNTTGINLSVDYDDYSQTEESSSDEIISQKIDVRSSKTMYRKYYIAAVEINWDYGIKKAPGIITPGEKRRGMRKFLQEYKKVVFREYTNENFLERAHRGELHEHLGIMGPFIKAEVNELLTVVFKNKASRPYSFHLQGVYDRTQGVGIAQSYAQSPPAGVPGEPVPPGETRVYNWKITTTQGPTDAEFKCKAGAYYSTVDKERDLHSGLIGPLLVCKNGTLPNSEDLGPEVQDYSLLFHTFDETKSWYLEENLKKHCVHPCQVNQADTWYKISNRFSAINGYVAETLPGLIVAQYQQVRWHLLNVGSDAEYHAVHFHGLPFTLPGQKHRTGIYNLFPGVFGTIEMSPSTLGTWLVECTVGDYQLAGMRAKLLVYDRDCALPLGMKSGNIKDSQITASDHRGTWEPHLARLDQSGYINAWKGTSTSSWIQVDLQKPTLLHGIQTQGVRSNLKANFIIMFKISYSLDQKTWIIYQGNKTTQPHKFDGNTDNFSVKDNRFLPPFVARYVRVQPESYTESPALRMELLGCDLNSCSNPLGVESGLIENITASSYRSSLLRKWSPTLARLHQTGRTNAWRPKENNPHQWLEVDLITVKRITGVITQGARYFGTPMMVTEFSVTVSLDRRSWSSVLEKDSYRELIFAGNNEPDEEALTVFEPALFGRFLRIHPRGWTNEIALRLEVLGCDTQQDL